MSTDDPGDEVNRKPEAAPEQVLALFQEHWSRGTPLSAVEHLDKFPHLWQRRSVIYDLVLDEVAQRKRLGQTIDLATYCQSFHSWKEEIFALLEIQAALSSHSCNRGSELDPVSYPVVGQSIDGLEILERLGGGGLSQVYLVREPHEKGGRELVLKVSKLRSREASFLGRLKHPRIADFHYQHPATDVDFERLTMPYVGRATFLDIVRLRERDRDVNAGAILDLAGQGCRTPDTTQTSESPWPANCNLIEAVATLLEQVADALGYLHHNKIVHGDLKPSNLLLSFSGNALLIDFNLAFDGPTALYRLGGTPAYLAPEILSCLDAEGDAGLIHPTPSADIYAFGVVAWELLLGKLSIDPMSATLCPHWSRLIDSIRSRQREFSARQLIDQGVDSLLAATVIRCLADDPTSRPTAEELFLQLQYRRSLRGRACRWRERNRGPFASAVSCLLLVIVGVTLWFASRPSFDVREIQSARLALTVNDLSKAATHTANAIEYNPTSIAVRNCQADLNLAQGQYEAAAGVYLQLAQVSKEIDKAYLKAKAGYCMAQRKNYRDATLLFRDAIAAGIEDAWVAHNLGVSCRALAQYREAMEWFTRAIQTQPSQGLSYSCRAECVAFQTDLPSEESLRLAIRDVEHALKLGPPHADHSIILARLWDRTSSSALRREKVEEHLRIAIALGADETSLPVRTLVQRYNIGIDKPAAAAVSHDYSPLTWLLSPEFKP